MKALLISNKYFPPQVGGISQIMASVTSSLGPEHICCLTGKLITGNGIDDGVKAKVYRRPMAFHKSSYLQAFGWSSAIAEIIFHERPQAVLIATIGDGYLGFWLQRWLRLPFVTFAHGNEILAVKDEQWPKSKLALKKANRILAVSKYTAGLVAQQGVDKERIEIFYPGCNVERFRPQRPKAELAQQLLGLRSSDKVILTVGNLVARKGHDMVIRALPRLLQSISDLTYLIVGDGPYRKDLESIAFELGVRDRVVFAGCLPGVVLPEIYALSDVFIMPSRHCLEACDVEGFGLVFLEASACAKPVIGGKSGGVPEAIEDGVSGLLVDPKDPRDIADALSRILLYPSFAKKLGEEGRNRVLKNFTWDRYSERLLEVLNSIALENR